MIAEVAVVIEDDDDIRELLVGLLTKAGFRVSAASRGRDGLREVAEHGPVLVTVDLSLPDMDGFEVTRRIRSLGDAQILLLTARTADGDVRAGFEAGADDYVTKPFRPRDLRTRIQAALVRSRAQLSTA